jgi:SAM-dependent methyltransferase
LSSRSGPPGRALDLGAGQGRDTVYLLRQGWSVTAVDRSAAAIHRIVQLCPAPLCKHLTVIESAFEEVRLPPDQDLVNASFSLPFCAADFFENFWSEIERVLKPGGVFCGHLLGPGDDWARDGVVTETPDQIQERFRTWAALDIETTFGPAATAKGRVKNWDLYKIVAVR